MSDHSEGAGWWQASNGRWYPPEQVPGGPLPPPPEGEPTWDRRPLRPGEGNPWANAALGVTLLVLAFVLLVKAGVI